MPAAVGRHAMNVKSLAVETVSQKIADVAGNAMKIAAIA